MPKMNRFDMYFDKETTKTTPKVQINSATLQVMGQTAKDCGYTKEEFIEAVEMYEHFSNIDLEDVPTPVHKIDYRSSMNQTTITQM